MTQPRKNRVDWDRWHDQMRRAARAKNRAVRLLIAEKGERFDELYEREGAAEGVVPRSTRRQDKAEDLQQQIKALQAQLDRIEQQAGDGSG